MLYIELYYFCTSRSKKNEGATKVNVIDIQGLSCEVLLNHKGRPYCSSMILIYRNVKKEQEHA